VIGVGKTSLAVKLRDHFGGENMFEEFEENPFLADFYKERRRYAFQTQMFFLLSRFHQQEKIKQTDLFQQYLISDYFFDKDRIFTSINLDGREMVLYDRVATALESQVVRPNLVVYLRSSVDRLMENIRLRHRAIETSMDAEYISELADAYNHFFSNYTKAPLLIIDSSSIDFINNISDFNMVIDEIENHHEGKKIINLQGNFHGNF